MKRLLCALLVVTVTVQSLVHGISHEDRLVTQLQYQLGKTGPIARPIPNGNGTEPVRLSLGLWLLRLSSLMSKDSSAELDVWIMMHWKEPRLSWDPANFGGLRQVALPSGLLWIPDIRLNHAGNFLPDTVSPLRAVVTSNSDVAYVLPAVLKVPCGRLRNGSVTCRARLGSWVYNSLELNTTLSDDPFNLDEYEPSENWDLVRATAKRWEISYVCCTESSIVVDYTVVFNPRPVRGHQNGEKRSKPRLDD